MGQLLNAEDAIARLKLNEQRLDIFVNEEGHYDTNTDPSVEVETLPSFMLRKEDELNAFGLAANGETLVSDEATLLAANTSGSVTSMVLLTSFAMTQNITLAKPFRPKPGAVITTTGYTFDTAGYMWGAGPYQVFAGSGVVAGLVNELPEWWGYDRDDTEYHNIVNAVRQYKGRYSTTGINPIAHRGYAGLAPENTLLAFSSAFVAGASAIELDVSMSSDGTPVVIHDSTVDRTTDGTGNVIDKTLAELQALDAGTFFSVTLANCRIPTLAQVLNYARGKFETVYIEVKGYRTTADVAIQVGAVNTAMMSDNVKYIANSTVDFALIRAAAPKAPIGLVIAVIGELADKVTYCANDGNSFLVMKSSVLLANPTAVTTARGKGVDIVVYTVTSHSQAESLAAVGVTEFFSDIPIHQNKAQGFGIGVDRYWQNTPKRITGGNSYSITGEVLTLVDVSATDRCTADIYFPAIPGDTITADVLAYLTSGTMGMYVELVDSKSEANLVGSTIFDAVGDWKHYKLTYQVPQTTTKKYVRIAMAGTAGGTGEAKFYHPRVSTTLQKSLTLAKGVVQVSTSGTVTPVMLANYLSYGVQTLEYVATDAIKITFDTKMITELRPLLFVSGTPNSPLVPLAGSPSFDASGFIQYTIKWTNGTATQDLTGLTLYFFFELKW